LAGFNQRRGYILIGEENSQQTEGEERLTCYGYKANYCKQFLFHATAFLFAGIPYVFCSGIASTQLTQIIQKVH
jgi:hypothetical protein